VIEETLVSLVDRFNRHTEKNPGVREELHDLVRIIELHLTDGSTFTLELKGGRLSPPRLGNGAKPNVKITTDTQTFEALVRKDLGPMKAMFSHKLTIDASLEDKLLLRRLL
jgi:putative sterol carrier protein